MSSLRAERAYWGWPCSEQRAKDIGSPYYTVFAERDIDVVIHTAGIANVDHGEQRFEEG